MQQSIVFALLGPIGIWELVIILLILMLIFGANRLSGLGKGMGQAIRGFKTLLSAWSLYQGVCGFTGRFLFQAVYRRTCQK